MSNIFRGNPLKAYIESLIKRAKWDLPKFDWDNEIEKLARGTLSKYGVRSPDPDTIHDAVMEALTTAIDQKFISAWDPKYGTSIPQYVLRRLQQRLITFAEKYRNEQKRRQYLGPSDSDDRSQEEQMDAHMPHHDPEVEFGFNNMLRDLHKYLSKRPDAKYMVKILDMTLKGHTATEIAKNMGVSSAAISGYFQKFKAALVEFARATDNKDLETMAKKIVNVKAAGPKDDAFFLKDMFEQYKRKHRASIVARYAANYNKLQVSRKNDILSDDYLGALIQSTEYTQDDIDSQIAAFIEDLEGMDDVLDENAAEIFTIRSLS